MEVLSTMAIAAEVAKEVYETVKEIQKVYNVSKEMKTVAESEGKDQLDAIKDIAGSFIQLMDESNGSPSESGINPASLEDSNVKTNAEKLGMGGSPESQISPDDVIFVDPYPRPDFHGDLPELTSSPEVIVFVDPYPRPLMSGDIVFEDSVADMHNEPLNQAFGYEKSTGITGPENLEGDIRTKTTLNDGLNGKFDNSNDIYESISSESEEGIGYENGTPLNSDRGHWDGDRGNSCFVFNPEAKPSSKNYGNLKDQTYAEMGKELGDSSPQVRFVKGNPVFDRDPGTRTGRPLEIKIEEGIDKYLNHDELLNGGKINREYLHTEAFNRMAEKYGISIDELKVFKGDSAPVKTLSGKWNCSEAEVWERCGNPSQIQRVLHEDKDQMTIQLVPRIYHDNVSHKGGIEEASNAERVGNRSFQ